MIGERLLELRKDAGLTQDELADILKINKHSISAYEREKSEPPDIIKISIAKYFDVSIDFLLGMTNDPSPSSDSHKIIRLPLNISDESLNSIKDYADYLIHKHTT